MVRRDSNVFNYFPSYVFFPRNKCVRMLGGIFFPVAPKLLLSPKAGDRNTKFEGLPFEKSPSNESQTLPVGLFKACEVFTIPSQAVYKES